MKFLRVLFLLAGSIMVQAAGPIPYAPAPNDRYYSDLWYLEGLATNTTRYAIDINARSAWSFTRGAGITIAIVDVGVNLTHPDLTNQPPACRGLYLLSVDRWSCARIPCLSTKPRFT